MEYESILETGSKTNEDRVTVLPEHGVAWVLDGASGFDSTVFPTAETDGCWYVNQFDAGLKRRVEESPDVSLVTIIKDVLRDVTLQLVEQMDFHPPTEPVATADDGLSHTAFPCATIAIVSWNENAVEYLSLGDAAVFVRNTDGKVQRFEHGSPEQYDAHSRQKVADVQDENPNATPTEVREMVDDTIVAVRELMQSPGGYWVLGTNPIAPMFAESGVVDREDISQLYLATDGLTPLVDQYAVFEDWTEAAHHIEKNGFKTAVNLLRSVEEDDPEMREYPRLKPHDDVGAARISFDQIE